MKTTMSSKGKIARPTTVGAKDHLKSEEELPIERVEENQCQLVQRRGLPNEGLVDWLLACPEKGFFIPIESESTDTVSSAIPIFTD
jgi:hypothetical protein